MLASTASRNDSIHPSAIPLHPDHPKIAPSLLHSAPRRQRKTASAPASSAPRTATFRNLSAQPASVVSMMWMPNTWTPAQIPSLVGKTALITGANSGIGYQAAVELARHGAHVMLGVRDVHKGHAALESLLREATVGHVGQGLTRPSAEIALLDLASLASIRNFALGFAARRQPLDILINNAGVMALPTRQLTEDGFERQFGTNHLGHFALTGYMVPNLLAADEPRVVTVSSYAHRNGRIDFDNLQLERNYTPWQAYQNSKLANLLFAFELHRRARAVGSKLISIACHPGVSRTQIVANGPGSDLKTS